MMMMNWSAHCIIGRIWCNMTQTLMQWKKVKSIGNQKFLKNKTHPIVQPILYDLVDVYNQKYLIQSFQLDLNQDKWIPFQKYIEIYHLVPKRMQIHPMIAGYVCLDDFQIYYLYNKKRKERKFIFDYKLEIKNKCHTEYRIHHSTTKTEIII